GASSCRHRPDDARSGALRSGRRNPRRSPEHPRWRLQQKPGTLRQKGARTPCKANRDLDQSTAENAKHPNLNSTLGCLKIVDTFRAVATSAFRITVSCQLVAQRDLPAPAHNHLWAVHQSAILELYRDFNNI